MLCDCTSCYEICGGLSLRTPPRAVSLGDAARQVAHISITACSKEIKLSCAQNCRKGNPKFWFCPLRKTSGDIKDRLYKRVAYAPIKRRCLRCPCGLPTPWGVGPCHATLASTRRRAIGIGNARAHSSYAQGCSVQAADLLRMRSAGSHVLYRRTLMAKIRGKMFFCLAGPTAEAHNSPTPWRRPRRSAYAVCHWYWQHARTASSVNKYSRLRGNDTGGASSSPTPVATSTRAGRQRPGVGAPVHGASGSRQGHTTTSRALGG
jgi:hypothetical protein